MAFWLLAALLVWPYVVAFRANAVGYMNDDGVYVVTAKALAEGQGYNLLSLPRVIPQTKYPVLFPLVLAGVWKLDPHFPGNIWLLRLVPLLFALGWFAASYSLIRREAGSARVGRWVALLVAGLPGVLLVSTADLSDVMFAALATAALILMGSSESKADADGVGDAAAAGALTGAAFLVRTAALPLLPVGAISLGARRKWRAAASYVAVSVLLAAPWAIWQQTHYQKPPREEAYYSMANYAQWNLVRNFTLPQKATIVRDNLEGEASAPGLLVTVGPWAILPLVGYILTALAVLGWIGDQRRWRSSLWLFPPFYLGMVTLWAFPPRRFVIPIMPLILYYAWRGLQTCCRRLGASERRVGAASIVILCLLLANGLIRQARLTARAGEVYQGDSVQEWHQAEALFAWARRETSPSAVFLTQWDTALYLYTGRRALRGYNMSAYELYYARKPARPLGTIAELAEGMLRQRVDYVATTGGPNSGGEIYFFRKLIVQLRASYPHALRDRYEFAPHCYVYRVDRAALAAAAGPKS